MNSTRILSGACALASFLLLAASPAHADDAPAATPFVTATTNVNLVSDYRFRGIDQTWGKPAIQGGADLVLAKPGMGVDEGMMIVGNEMERTAVLAARRSAGSGSGSGTGTGSGSGQVGA